MMDWIELNDNVVKLCADNYKDNCGKCDLRPLCVRSYGNTNEMQYACKLQIDEISGEDISDISIGSNPSGILTKDIWRV